MRLRCFFLAFCAFFILCGPFGEKSCDLPPLVGNRPFLSALTVAFSLAGQPALGLQATVENVRAIDKISK